MAQLDSAILYHGSTWLNLTLLYSLRALLGFTRLYCTITWLYLVLLDSTTLYHRSTSLYYILPWFYLALLDSTTFYHGSTGLYLTLPHPAMHLLDSTGLYHGSTWLYLALLGSTTLYHGSCINYRAVATGPVSPVSTGPLFPSPMACLASPNRANAQQTPMARTQRGDMLQHNTRWFANSAKDRVFQQFSVLPTGRSAKGVACEISESRNHAVLYGATGRKGR